MEEVMLNRLRLIAKQMGKFSSPLTESSLQEMEIHINKLESIIARFCSELNNYFRLSQDPAADDIAAMSLIQLEAEEKLAELKVKLKNTRTPEGSLKINEDSNLSVSGKLPKLSLPEFDGDVLNWHQFWDQFSSNIDSRNLAEVDKLLYLKASLKGEARKVLDGLDTTNKNYQLALTSLKERYGKQNLLVDSHYSALYKIKPASNNLSDFRKVLNEIEQHLRVLCSLGEDINHNHLRFMILEKFPEEIIYELKSKTTASGIDDIRKELETIISAKEDASRITKENVDNKNFTVETLHVSTERKPFNMRNFMRPRPYLKNKDRNVSYRPNHKGFNPGKRCDDKYRNNLPKQHEILKRRHTEGNGKGEPPRKKLQLRCAYCKETHYSDRCLKFDTLQKRKANLKKRCFICLAEGHVVANCKNKKYCWHCKQYGVHHRSLCPKIFSPKDSVSTCTLHVQDKGATVLQTAVVQVEGEDVNAAKIKCRLLLDSGSQRSYVTQNIIKTLHLPIVEENKLTVFTFGSTTPQEFDSPLVRLRIKTRTNKSLTIYANVVPTISQSIPYPEKELKNWTDKSQLADDGSLEDAVNILIGNDYYHSIMSTEKIKVGENLYLVQSELGWILSGKTDGKTYDDLTVVTYFQSSVEVKFNQPDLPLNNISLKYLWDLESIGITDSPNASRDDEAIKNFNDTTEFINGRYTVSWPWNQYPPELPSNFGLAHGRLVHLLKRTPNLYPYHQTIKEQLEKGIIEVVPGNEVDHPVHYLPFHGVQQAGKSLRIVYDASAKTKDNKSLNQCLYCGPMMLENLTGLLLKFRGHQIGISSDVEKAFLQIALHENDRDVTRFLWVKDTNKPATMENLLHLRFTRVPFGVISSPFLLNATIRHHLSKSDIEMVRKIADNIYVDNVITGSETTQEALELYKNSKDAFNEISMNLRDWVSNSQEFMNAIHDTSEKDDVTILGLRWNLYDDTLEIKVKDINRQANTKRKVLQTVASIYDPCGYTVPFMLPAKMLIQELWKLKVKWDTPLSKELTDKWTEICEYIEEIKTLKIPRYYMKSNRDDCELHCFTDASLKAYAAVVYIVSDNEASFVMGKSRLAPIKDQDNLKIPRLELLGVLIGSRLIKYVAQTLQLLEVKQILWTDNTIVIEWYKSNKLLAPFVERRISEIKNNKILEIKHIPSELNPADVATKINVKADRRIWLSGPKLPLTDSSSSFLAREGLPKKTEDRPNTVTLMEATPMERHEELNSSETNKEIKELQAKHFPDEISGMKTNLARNLGLFMDTDGLLRCKGRLKNADWPYDKRYPILIPRNDAFTDKLIMVTHEENYHVGPNHTLSAIRQNYWIPKGKSQVQKVLRKCPRCIKHGGGPFQLPPTPALPAERVNYSAPFTFTGLDYLGPVQVKNKKDIEKRWICLFTCLAVRAIHLEIVKDLTAEEGLLALRRMIATRGVPNLITSDNAAQFKLMAEILEKPYCIERKIRWRFIPQLAPWFGGFYERLIGIVKVCMQRTLSKHLLNDSQLSTVIKEIEGVVNSRPLTCVDTEVDHVLKPADFLTVGRLITMKTSCEDPISTGTATKTNLISSWKRALVILDEFKEMFVNRYLPSLRERYNNSLQQPRVKTRLQPRIGQLVQIKGATKNRELWKVGKIVALPESSEDGQCRIAKVDVDGKEFTRSIAHLYPLEIENEIDDITETNNLEKHEEIVSEPIEEVRNEEELDGISESLNTEEILDKESPVIANTESTRGRRNAATRALKKIREWTHNLLLTLL